MRITTLRIASGCSDVPPCPSIHHLDTDIANRYVVSKRADRADTERLDAPLRPGELLGWLPTGLAPDSSEVFARTRRLDSALARPERRYVITMEVHDPEVRRLFVSFLGADEQLGTVPALLLTGV